MTHPQSDEPILLTVPEAAALLRISRSHTYDMANLWLHTKGREGIPCLRLGKRLLIHRARLLAWAEGAAG